MISFRAQSENTGEWVVSYESLELSYDGGDSYIDGELIDLTTLQIEIDGTYYNSIKEWHHGLVQSIVNN